MLPLDCIGQIVLYLSDVQTLFKVLILSSDVKKYIEDYRCSRNVVFYFKKPPINVMPYVCKKITHIIME